MASPESSSNISRGEKIGYIARNFGVLLVAGAIFAPQYLGVLFWPSAGLAAAGYKLKEVSKK